VKRSHWPTPVERVTEPPGISLFCTGDPLIDGRIALSCATRKRRLLLHNRFANCVCSTTFNLHAARLRVYSSQPSASEHYVRANACAYPRRVPRYSFHCGILEVVADDCGLIAEGRTQSSVVRIRTSEKPARLRYVSISCGVEFCVIWGGRFVDSIARWVSKTFQPPSEQRFILST